MIQTTKHDVAVSPCINVCTLDATRSLCRGCFRTVDEISAWSRLANGERLAIVAAAAQRRAESSR